MYLGLVVPELAEVEKEVVVLGLVAADEAEFLDNVVDLAARALVRVVELGARRSVNANAAEKGRRGPVHGLARAVRCQGPTTSPYRRTTATFTATTLSVTLSRARSRLTVESLRGKIGWPAARFLWASKTQGQMLGDEHARGRASSWHLRASEGHAQQSRG